MGVYGVFAFIISLGIRATGRFCFLYLGPGIPIVLLRGTAFAVATAGKTPGMAINAQTTPRRIIEELDGFLVSALVYKI